MYDFSPCIIGSRIVIYFKPGCPFYPTDITIYFCGQIVLFFIGTVAWHEVEHDKFSFVGREMGG